MTDRERWTVYPLLFLTLGIAVKDKIENRSNVDTVLCNTIKVHDRNGREQVVITSTPAGGLVRTHGTKTGVNVLVGHVENLAGIMFVDAAGNMYSGPAAIQTSVLPKPSAAGHGAAAEKKPAEDARPRTPPETPDPKAPNKARDKPADEQP